MECRKRTIYLVYVGTARTVSNKNQRNRTYKLNTMISEIKVFKIAFCRADVFYVEAHLFYTVRYRIDSGITKNPVLTKRVWYWGTHL